MEKTIIGIDISMDDFHACVKIRTATGSIKIKGTRSFQNTAKGFEELLAWALKRKKGKSMRFVMEATGVYYEDLAYFLHENDQAVSVVLANKIRNYTKSLNIKTKTDRVDSKVIAGFGIERNLEGWEPMSPQYKELRDLCREMLSLKKEKQRAGSQLHAMEKSHNKHQSIIDLKTEQIKFYEEAIGSLKKGIREAVGEDPDLKEKIRKVQTSPGLGFETIVILACETNGFALFKNIRQVVSYAGLDVSFNESGKFTGKMRISKKGNSRIRQALYMPALSAIQANEPIKEMYQRVCERNPDIKQKGVVAGMRKLLVLAYTLWKKNEEYDKGYKWGLETSGNEEIKPSFGQFCGAKKSGAYLAPHKIDFSSTYRPEPSFGHNKDKKITENIRI
ncbi:MAG TPA: IS110 family transposase [Salinimicrobium sp.]|nr:IS110 family transposase [Salinimicrobium sp.]